MNSDTPNVPRVRVPDDHPDPERFHSTATIEELAAIGLGHPNRLYEKCADGRIPATKTPGGRWLVALRELSAVIGFRFERDPDGRLRAQRMAAMGIVRKGDAEAEARVRFAACQRALDEFDRLEARLRAEDATATDKVKALQRILELREFILEARRALGDVSDLVAPHLGLRPRPRNPRSPRTSPGARDTPPSPSVRGYGRSAAPGSGRPGGALDAVA
jgi:hypothetical protein